VREDDPGVGKLGGELEGVPSEGGDSPAGMDQNGQSPIVCQREDASGRRPIDGEGVGAWMELDAPRPALDTTR
jgi:hypothetical protein